MELDELHGSADGNGADFAVEFKCANCFNEWWTGYAAVQNVGKYGILGDGCIHHKEKVVTNRDGYGTYTPVRCPLCSSERVKILDRTPLPEEDDETETEHEVLEEGDIIALDEINDMNLEYWGDVEEPFVLLRGDKEYYLNYKEFVVNSVNEVDT